MTFVTCGVTTFRSCLDSPRGLCEPIMSTIRVGRCVTKRTGRRTTYETETPTNKCRGRGGGSSRWSFCETTGWTITVSTKESFRRDWVWTVGPSSLENTQQKEATIKYSGTYTRSTTIPSIGNCLRSSSSLETLYKKIFLDKNVFARVRSRPRKTRSRGTVYARTRCSFVVVADTFSHEGISPETPTLP